jgi:predicted nucleic acid-binding protein
VPAKPRILLKEVRIRPLDWDLMQAFGKVHLRLKEQGRALSFVDKLLAALAQHENATLLTTDSDFEALPDVRTESWLS